MVSETDTPHLPQVQDHLWSEADVTARLHFPRIGRLRRKSGRDKGEDGCCDLAKAAKPSQAWVQARGHRRQESANPDWRGEGWGAGVASQQLHCAVSSLMAVWVGVGTGRLWDPRSGCSLSLASKHEADNASVQKEV